MNIAFHVQCLEKYLGYSKHSIIVCEYYYLQDAQHSRYYVADTVVVIILQERDDSHLRLQGRGVTAPTKARMMLPAAV